MNALQAMRAESLSSSLLALFHAGLPRLAGQPRRQPGAERRSAATGPAAAVPLARSGLRWVQRPRGWVVTCESGALWLTFDGEEHDIVLEAGQSHRCESDSRLAIYALSAAQVQLRPAPVPR